MEVERSSMNSIFLPMLTYGTETWTRSTAQQSRVSGVYMNHLRGVCGVTTWNSESNEGMYERPSMEMCENGVVWSGGVGEREYSNSLATLRGWGEKFVKKKTVHERD